MPLHIVAAYPENDCKVYVTKTGKTVWVASGTFMEKHLSVNGSSEHNALAKWIDIAEWRYRTS